MKKKLFFAMAVTALSSLMLSCSSSDETEDLGDAKTVVNMLSNPVPINLTPEQQVFANDNNQFTLNFLKTVNETDLSGKSFIYSPLSITYVLGMVNDAATGQTERELEQTLGFHEGGIQAVNDYCKKLIDGLPKVDSDVTLNIANAIFLNKNYTLKSQFEQDMQTYYDAKAEALDFFDPSTLDHINGWCNEKTKGMIPFILEEVDPCMVSYLLNAIYFKADWTSKFDEKNTKEEAFTTENGTTRVPMMHQNVLIQYMKNDTYSAIEMPYGNGLWRMNVILPEEGKSIDDVIDCLKEDYENRSYRAHEVDLKLPRYETESDTDKAGGLINLMQKMGIQLAFNPYLSEIPNMATWNEQPVNLYIAMMRQKAKIKVNEEGSEAAAVTVAGLTSDAMGPSTPPEYPKAIFHANRPFVYVIREASSGVILFVGKFSGV
ncbi:MAG: serpin family protein [Prevotella sp.]|nr:serpin family protein [Prevotella sp.]